MIDYSGMTYQDFDRLLLLEVENTSAQELLTIPGIYEVLSEHFNNAVLSSWDEEQEDDRV